MEGGVEGDEEVGLVPGSPTVVGGREEEEGGGVEEGSEMEDVVTSMSLAEDEAVDNTEVKQVMEGTTVSSVEIVSKMSGLICESPEPEFESVEE